MIKKELFGSKNRQNKFKTAAISLFVGLFLSIISMPSVLYAANSDSTVLIVYYSRSGHTKALAQQIHSVVGGDLIELETIQPYPNDYRETTQQAKRELESGYLPALKAIPNIDSYDTIFIGSPCWWGTMAPAVRTFLSQGDLAGKTLLPFMTHGGSGLGSTVTDLRKICPTSTVTEGLAVRGNPSNSVQTEITQWLQKVGFKK